MPKVSRKRKAEVTQNDDGGSIFDHFARQELPGGGTGGVDKEDVAQKPDVTADLMKQIAEMNARLEAAERTNIALLSAAPKQPEPQIKYEDPSDDDLPDPTMDPGGYARAVSARAEKRLEAYMAQQRQEAQQKSTVETSAKDLWTDFSSQYEDYAEDEERVSFAAGQVMKELQSRGIDVARYTTTARDKFFKDVTSRMDKIFGKPGNDEDDETPEATRTAGVFGGLESGGKPAKGSQEQPGDMIKDLHDLQRKSGFF